MKDVVELSKASVEKIDPDVLITHYKSGSEIHEEDAKEIDGAHLTMSQGGEMFVLVDLTAGGTKIDKSAEDFFYSKGRMLPYTKAVAIVRDHKPSILNKLFHKTSKALFPTKEFTDKEAAKAWFDSMRN